MRLEQTIVAGAIVAASNAAAMPLPATDVQESTVTLKARMPQDSVNLANIHRDNSDEVAPESKSIFVERSDLKDFKYVLLNAILRLWLIQSRRETPNKPIPGCIVM
ncbi:hypothetical protein BU24DRAFT_406584 [Aaosphaeria arxii CBS 175.79]|uniref:Uncharacterized protein n=1 Tax=Aaosphaeria arxii CBS 175.79 TaxID=1450172 RepID=A0A6A5Y377_9PLEO|nr:uncharacterized protein BU24DRAFT_406584 [Aaosphaeria arxii CBS 175.79]KAF2019982.1 hypothetical protein BU24DRAFT_406584 [Aaosphaeria arxii CBS 175.79]